MNVNIGQLNKRISIAKVNKEKDVDGYWAESEVLVHTTWARFSERTGKEILRNDTDYSEVVAEFLIRRTQVKLSRKMVVLFGGNRYEIQHVGPYPGNSSFFLIAAKLLTTEG